jgi:Domain of unknown function (DUF4864)
MGGVISSATIRSGPPANGRPGRTVAQRAWLGLAVVLIAVLGQASPARAADEAMRASTAEVRREVVAVIEAQLAAFRAGEPAQAHALAAAALRAQKPLRVFTEIVRTNYPEIWTNTRAECGLVRDDGTLAKLVVHVIGKDGDANYDYTLAKERDGWRIRDVLRHTPPKAGKT